MKKSILLFVGILSFTFSSAQYESGDIDISVGTGFGLYGASTNDVNAVDTTGVNAAAGLINLNVNYAIIDKIAVGVNFERNSFVTTDDSTNTDSYGYSYNYKLIPQFRFKNSEKNCIALKAGIGLTYFKFGDRKSNEYVKGDGINYEFGVDFQHYFGEHVGLFLNVGYTGYNYSKLIDQDNEVWRTNNDTDNMAINFSGVNARIGLQIKI